jgi:(R)-2-hydroxyacyl-CoA dehydratese activating ATPase
MAAPWYAMGVDLGSTTAKAVLLDAGGAIAATDVVQMGAVSREAVGVAIGNVLRAAGIDESRVVRTVSTGYGRRLVPGSDKTVTEITCHARGAAMLSPGVRLVVDVGGQDSKAIAVDGDGLVDRFALNDRCASGTGRFFDLLARALEVDLDEVSRMALRSTGALEVSSMCATFAETEVISLLAEGSDKADVSASVHRAVAGRTLGLIAQVGKASPVVMTGGVAKNEALRTFLSGMLGMPIQTLEQPQIAGALGAALIARDEHLSGPAGGVADVDPERQLVRSGRVTPSSCAACESGSGDHHHAVPVILDTSRRQAAVG